MALSGTKYLIAVMAVFPLFFITTLFRSHFPIKAARTFVGAFNAKVIAFLELLLQCTRPFFWERSAWALGPNGKWAGITNSLAP